MAAPYHGDRRGICLTGGLIVGIALLSAGCAIEPLGSSQVKLTRPIPVNARDVRVFADATDVTGRFQTVDTVWVKDDGDTPPAVLLARLREMAGARGANALITDPHNRQPNGTRIDLHPTIDDPFDYFSATAIWIGEGDRPERQLGATRR